MKRARREAPSRGAANPTALQQTLLVLLRMGIGWHFLYEGYVKLINPAWTAKPYLENAFGPAGGLFHALAANAQAVTVVDFLNSWGLAAAGAGLMLGALTQIAGLGAALMLVLYYISHPSWITVPPMPAEGSYLLIDKTIVELLAVLTVVVFRTGRFAGLDALWYAWRGRRKARSGRAAPAAAEE